MKKILEFIINILLNCKKKLKDFFENGKKK